MTGADFKSLLEQAADGPLTREEAETVFEIIMTGGATPVRIAGFLMALRARGEDTAEIAAAAAVMRRHAVAVEAPEGAIDVVGTGGDGKGTLNISTAAAFITAGAGVPVAKHGNRALSSRSGAADALGLLGVDVSVGPEVVARAINEAGIGFMMAPMHHPAMRHVQPVRIELAARTIFNILGPLTNPAGVKRQLTGAFSVAALNPMAETLRALGSEKAWLVHGGDGTDEISIAGPTTVVQLADGVIAEFEVSPELAGLPVHPFEDIIGGAPEENVARLRALLDGEAGAYRDASLLNAGAALLIADRVADLAEGVEMAAESVDSGAAKRAVEALARITTEAAAAVKAD